MSKGPSIKELIEVSLVVVIGFAGFLFLQSTNFSSVSSSTDSLSRFIWAFSHTAFPTNQFEIILELAVAAVGYFTVSKVSSRLAVFVGFTIYFSLSFLIAYFTAPI